MATYIIDYHDSEFDIIKEDLYSTLKTGEDNHKLNIVEVLQDLFYQIYTLDDEIINIFEPCIVLLEDEQILTLKQDKRFSQIKHKFKIYHDNWGDETREYQEEYQGSFLDVIRYLYDF